MLESKEFAVLSKGSLLGLLQFTHLEVCLVVMSLRGKKDGFMNILKSSV